MAHQFSAFLDSNAEVKQKIKYIKTNIVTFMAERNNKNKKKGVILKYFFHK